MTNVIATIGQLLLAGEKACCKENCSVCPYRIQLPLGDAQLKVCLFRIAESFTSSDDFAKFDNMTTLVPAKVYMHMDISRAKRRMIFGNPESVRYIDDEGIYTMVNGTKVYEEKVSDYNAGADESSELVGDDNTANQEVLQEHTDEEIPD